MQPNPCSAVLILSASSLILYLRRDGWKEKDVTNAKGSWAEPAFYMIVDPGELLCFSFWIFPGPRGQDPVHLDPYLASRSILTSRLATIHGQLLNTNMWLVKVQICSECKYTPDFNTLVHVHAHTYARMCTHTQRM